MRHSVAINGGVPAPASAKKGAKGSPTEGYVSPPAQPETPAADTTTAEPATPQGPLTGDAARAAAPASLNTGRGLTDEQEGGLGFYRAAGYEIVNDYLRDDPRFGQYYAGTEQLAEERVGVIDSAMDGSRLTDDVEVWRGIENPQRLFGDALDGDMTGATWTERAYLSTTTDPDVADRFAGASTSDPGVRMRITAPQGTGAVELSGDSYESELLMERNLELRVTADHGVDERGVRHLDVEIVPANRGAGDEDTAEPASEPDTPAQPDTGSQPATSDRPDRPGSTGQPADSRPSIGDMIDRGAPTILDNDEASRERRRQAMADFGAVANGAYAGLDVEVTGARRFFGGEDGGRPGVAASMTIRDPDGNEVGRSERAFYRDENGDLVAYHELLELDPEVRGRGFAAEFNANLIDWYREQGVTRVELDANIDVGGYAWASQGFDFATENDANRIADRLRQRMFAYEQDGHADQVAEARALLDRMDGTRFGSADYPTPYEFSQIGRAAGGDTWLGRDTMLGSYWGAVRWL